MKTATYVELYQRVRHRLSFPALVALGVPGSAADLAQSINRSDTVCYQMDQFQADRLREQLTERKCRARVEVAPDLWDLSDKFGSVIVPSPARGERELKIDVVEQSYHVLRDRGVLAVLSPVERDQFYQPLLKKIFGHVALETVDDGTVFWSPRDGERKRRRHEVKFTTKLRDGEFVEFTSRPGVFAYGRLDDGSRSLLDVLEIRSGERIVDLGCGCGVVGIIAAMRAGDRAHVTLADSNARAVALAKLNAFARGLKDFSAQVTTDFGSLPARSYDLALANPPYFARHTITRLFVERAHGLLRRGGRLYLVTRQLEPVEPILEEFFPPPLVMTRRDYAILVATRMD